MYDVLRACVDAFEASGAALVVDECDAVDQADGSERTRVDAAAEADAAVGALGRPAGNTHRGVAILDAYVLKFLLCVITA